MSEFSDAFAPAFDAAASIFGESCRINGRTYPCIIHALDLKTQVNAGFPGKRQAVTGNIILSAAVWAQVRGRKGMTIDLGTQTLRVMNDPDIGVSDTVNLQLGPQT